MAEDTAWMDDYDLWVFNWDIIIFTCKVDIILLQNWYLSEVSCQQALFNWYNIWLHWEIIAYRYLDFYH